MARFPRGRSHLALRLFSAGLLLLSAGSAGILQDSSLERMEVVPGVTGYWAEDRLSKKALPEPWGASWIWMEEEVAADMMLARRSFLLGATPERAVLRITATSRYELYVNGTYVSRGPARSAPHHQFYDVFEIADLLRQDQNTLAVRVHYLKGGVSYHHAGRPGLLAQLDLSPGDRFPAVSTNASWKVHSDPSWDSEAPKMSRFHLQVCDRVDLRDQWANWTEVGFDDRSWPKARALMREVGWPGPQENSGPQALTPPWTQLVRRDLPYLRENIVKAVELREARPAGEEEIRAVEVQGRIDSRIAGQIEPYRVDTGPLRLPRLDSGRWFLLFEFESLLNGRPRLDIEGPAGATVRIHSAPFLIDDLFTGHVVDSVLIDRVTLSGNRDLWEAAYFKPVRYLGVEIEGGAGPVDLYFAGVRQTEYPFAERGALQTPEKPWFEKLWKAAARTIRACTTDAYTDNYRERRQYAQTGYYAALGNYWTFGDTALQRRYLQQIAQEQEANGMMPAYAPLHGDDYMVILDSNCLWIRGLRNYFLYSGDEKTTRELLPAARKLLELLHRYTNEDGLIEDPPFAYWIDHARIDRRGAAFTLNAHYLGALEDFSETLDWLGETDAGLFQSRAARLKGALRERFWNPGRGLFCDALVRGEQSSSFSEHANGLALALEIATHNQAEAIARQLLARDRHNYIRRPSGITMVTPAMSYFFHEGLCRMGYVQESLSLLEARFSHMLRPGSNQTLWEEWWLDGTGRSGAFVGGRTRSDAQTESAFAPDLLGRYLLGIRPTRPGLEEIILARSDSALSTVEGRLPTPRGDLMVSWKSIQGLQALDVEIPSGMRVKLDLQSLVPSAQESIEVDGRALQLSGTRDFLALGGGRHRVRF